MDMRTVGRDFFYLWKNYSAGLFLRPRLRGYWTLTAALLVAIPRPGFVAAFLRNKREVKRGPFSLGKKLEVEYLGSWRVPYKGGVSQWAGFRFEGCCLSGSCP